MTWFMVLLFILTEWSSQRRADNGADGLLSFWRMTTNLILTDANHAGIYNTIGLNVIILTVVRASVSCKYVQSGIDTKKRKSVNKMVKKEEY